MLLQTILYGTWEAPKVKKTRKHRIGMCGGQRYIEPIKRDYGGKDGFSKAEYTMLQELKKLCKHISANDLGQMINLTRNHCNVILGQLFKKNLVNRYKVRANGTYLYMYILKENDHAR